MTPVSANTSQAVPPFQEGHCLCNRITGEYLEMPGLNLTLAQAMRLFDVDRSTCTRALNDLVDAGFLMRDETDRYVQVAWR